LNDNLRPDGRRTRPAVRRRLTAAGKARKN